MIPVHLYGRTVDDIDAILDLARARDLRVIEDACQAHGALHRGRRAGSIGDAGCFSFYPAKNLGAWGDGGGVVTDDEQLAEQIRLLRSHGERPSLPPPPARAPPPASTRSRRRSCASSCAASTNGTIAAARSPPSSLRCSRTAPSSCRGPPPRTATTSSTSTWSRATAATRCASTSTSRGIASGIHYPVPIHLSDAYAGLGLRQGDLPVAERAAERCCSLPISPFQTDAETERVAEAVASFAAEGG